MTEQRKHFPDFYVTAPQPCPYLAGRFERKLFTHLTHDKSVAAVDGLLKSGFRRSQNIAYMPYCEGCRACVSVRVIVDEFRPVRGMSRTDARNRELLVRRSVPVATSEQYRLFRDYVAARHADGGMADMSALDYAVMIEDSVVPTFVSEYRLPREAGIGTAPEASPLVAVALCDRLSDGISMVYSFFDPEQSARSLGTFMIIDHIAYARRQGLPYLYLGYWIDGSPKMNYKARFHPHERLGPAGWARA